MFEKWKTAKNTEKKKNEGKKFEGCCYVMVHIPMKGRISSLNASAAASLLLYEAVRQRLG